MSRLPTPGSDDGTWGAILNDFLEVEHNADGTLKKAADIANKYTKPTGGIPKSDLASAVQTSLETADTAAQSVNGKTGPTINLTANDVNAIPASQVGANDGVASLDSSGKVPTSELPEAIATGTSYKGSWDASANSPSLADGTGTDGDFYRVSVAGTRNLGSGSLSWAVGDFVLYDGGAWTKVPGIGEADLGTIFSGQHAGTLASTALGQYTIRYKTIKIPVATTLTGIGIATGNVSNGNVKVFAAHAGNGIVLASSASTAQSTAGIAQKVPFTSSLSVSAGRLIIGIISDSTTSTVYTTTMGLEPYVVAANGSFNIPTTLSVLPTDVAIAANVIIWTY